MVVLSEIDFFSAIKFLTNNIHLILIRNDSITVMKLVSRGFYRSEFSYGCKTQQSSIPVRKALGQSNCAKGGILG